MSCSLSNLFVIKAGGDIDKALVKNKKDESFKYPVISNSLTNDGLYGFTNSFKHENSITVTGRGEIGIAVSRPYKYYPIVRLLSLIPKRPIDLIYFESLINSRKVLVESTGVPQLLFLS